jgi:hypothetical protein
MALWSLAARAGIPAARSALSFLSKLKKPKGGGITLFRGESFPPRNIETAKSAAKHFGTTVDKIKKDKLFGQWYTPNYDHARAYASGILGKVKKVNVTPAELAAFHRYKNLVNKTNVKWSEAARMGSPFKQRVTTSPHHVIIPRYKLKQLPSTSDYFMKDKLARYIASLKSQMGLKHGGLARILEV